jgi:23S rRNA (uracil1939-C5)-methyltransferase
MTVATERVRITAIAAGGDGVGRLADGRAVFVPRTVPGDLIEPLQLEVRARFARARSARIVEPGPERVTPPCLHYLRDQCGGCQLQHLSSTGQQAVRRAIVGDALRRIAHLDVTDPPIESAGLEWGYRTKLTLAVKAGGRVIGLHQVGAPDRVFDLDRCEIAVPALNQLWTAVRAERRQLPGNAEHLVLRLARDGTRHLLIQCGAGPAWTGGPALRGALDRAGSSVTIWWQPEGGAARVVSGAPDAYPATVFEQIHPSMGDRVRRHAIGALGPVEGLRVWDLYAGIGETTNALLAQGATVDSVELDSRAVAVAGPPDGPGVRRHVGAAEEISRRLPDPDLVITNPPRTGMDQRVVDAIRAAGPRRLVYISCDPATLARDLARLLAPAARRPFRLVGLQAFDLFPQTSHVETVAVLEVA